VTHRHIRRNSPRPGSNNFQSNGFTSEKTQGIYWTLGDHDGVVIFQAPDDETASTLLLDLGAAGNVHTTTVRGFTAAEMDKILDKRHSKMKRIGFTAE
jgi:uncharacterized protein with GYD domain